MRRIERLRIALDLVEGRVLWQRLNRNHRSNPLRRHNCANHCEGGAFLTTFLSAPDQPTAGPKIGLGRDDLPFKRDEGEAAALRHVRHHSKYLATGRLWERIVQTRSFSLFIPPEIAEAQPEILVVLQ